MCLASQMPVMQGMLFLRSFGAVQRLNSGEQAVHLTPNITTNH